MPCLGGSRDAPRSWVRIQPDGRVEQHDGRICDRAAPGTDQRQCGPCPAYRGVRRDTTRATGLYPSGEPYALSLSEYELYERAIEATFDDDFTLLGLFEARLDEGIGDQALRRIGDPDALERRAKYMRDYRAERVERTRELNREHARAYRSRRRERASVTAPTTHPTGEPPPARAGHGGARVRDGAVTDAGRSRQ